MLSPCYSSAWACSAKKSRRVRADRDAQDTAVTTQPRSSLIGVRPTWRSTPAAAVIALALLLGVFTINTQPIAVNDGFGYDGLHYARLTLSLREGSTLVLTAPYADRVLPAEIVARSGMEI